MKREVVKVTPPAKNPPKTIAGGKKARPASHLKPTKSVKKGK